MEKRKQNIIRERLRLIISALFLSIILLVLGALPTQAQVGPVDTQENQVYTFQVYGSCKIVFVTDWEGSVDNPGYAGKDGNYVRDYTFINSYNNTLCNAICSYSTGNNEISQNPGCIFTFTLPNVQVVNFKVTIMDSTKTKSATVRFLGKSSMSGSFTMPTYVSSYQTQGTASIPVSIPVGTSTFVDENGQVQASSTGSTLVFTPNANDTENPTIHRIYQKGSFDELVTSPGSSDPEYLIGLSTVNDAANHTMKYTDESTPVESVGGSFDVTYDYPWNVLGNTFRTDDLTVNNNAGSIMCTQTNNQINLSPTANLASGTASRISLNESRQGQITALSGGVNGELGKFNPFLLSGSRWETNLIIFDTSISGSGEVTLSANYTPANGITSSSFSTSSLSYDLELPISVYNQGTMPTPTDIVLSQNRALLDVENVQYPNQVAITATVKPSGYSYPLDWTSDNVRVARVQSGGQNGNVGIIQAVGDGTATVTVSYQNLITETIAVTVSSTILNIDQIELDTESVQIDLSSGNPTAQIKASIKPSNTIAKLIWTTGDTDIATVTGDNTGAVITATGIGSTTISATAGDVSESVEVTVEKSSDEITISPESLLLDNTGIEYPVSAILTATAGSNGTTEVPLWVSDNPGVASVTGNAFSARVEALSEGTAIISATYNGKTAEVPVTVTSTESIVSNIVVNPPEVRIDLTSGVNTAIITTTLTEPPNTTEPIIWTSQDKSVATVTGGNEGAVITAVGLGTTTVSATAGGFTREVPVTVTGDLSSGITLMPDQLLLDATGKTYPATETVQAILSPVGAQGAPKWSSADTSIATITPNGLTAEVTGVSEGTTVITASYEGHSAQIPVTVRETESEVSNIILHPTYVAIDLESKNPTAIITTVETEPPNTEETIIWTSEDESVATVLGGNEGAVITGVSAGQTTVKATAGAFSAEVTVEVLDAPPEVPTTGIVFNEEEITLSTKSSVAQSSATLSAQITPADATDAITWQIEPKEVATLSQESYNPETGQANATITAEAEGIATVTISSGQQSASATIRVTDSKVVSNLGFIITSDTPDSFEVTGEEITGNPAIGLEDEPIGKVSFFAWSAPDQSDIQAIVGEHVPGTNSYRARFTTNGNETNTWFEDASNIHLNVYASLTDPTDPNRYLGDGELIYAANYDTVNSLSCGTNRLAYIGYIQNIGFQTPTVFDGGIAGTVGEDLQMEGVRLQSNIDGVSLTYRVHVQNVGWTGYVADGTYAGTMHRNLQLEAIQIFLYGDNARNYQVQYRTYVENIGWTNWVTQGNISGTTGENLQIEAIQAQLVPRV